jgi:hypothetical protein
MPATTVQRTARSASRVPAPIILPAARSARSMSLARALSLRQTTRTLSDRPLPLPLLSGLLWSACGVNRAKGPFGLSGRTAASASNSQEIDVYVACAEATYRYEPLRHRLIPVVQGDLRSLAISRGQNASGSIAPVRLLYVVDIDKLEHTAGFQEPGLQDPEIQRAYAHVDTGIIAAHVYLYAAANGLAAWFHNCDKPALAAALGLRAHQRALFAHTVGYPR